MAPDAAGKRGGLDERLFVLLRTRAHYRPLEVALAVLSMSGNWGIFWVGAGAALWAAGALAERRDFIYLLAVVYVTLVLNFTVKIILKRERPVSQDPALRPLVGTPSSKSFPSSHAAMSFAAACALTALYPRLWPLYFGVALVMSWSRVYVGVHYPSDVLAGTGLGLVTGAAAIMLINIF